MKRPANVADLTAELTAASTAPLVAPPRQEPAPEPERKAPRKAAAASKPVFLRVPGRLYDRYEAEAVTRTKATGKGVTIQQVMLEKLEGDA